MNRPFGLILAISLLIGCADDPELVDDRLYTSLTYLLTHRENFAPGQKLAVHGHLYGQGNSYLFLSRESAIADDVLSGIVVLNPVSDRGRFPGPCDGKFVEVFGTLHVRGEEYSIADVTRVEIPPRKYPRVDPEDWEARACFDAEAAPAA